MARPAAQVPSVDPLRSTLVAVLRQLNQAETVHEEHPVEQSLELAEIERRLSDLPAVERGEVHVAFALGLLLRNRLVRTESRPDYSWQRERNVAQRYRITTEGKRFLTEALATETRIR